MKKKIENLGKVLTKEDQKKIKGGLRYCDATHRCRITECCIGNACQLYACP